MLGSTLNRRYRLEQRLGASNSQHYLATDASNGEMLSVRFLPRHVSLRGELGLRYRRALARLKGLHHPHLLIPVEAATADGVVFLASPYYPSISLNEALAQQPVTLVEAADVLRQVASALDVLHHAGVVHGGINLDNVLIAREDGIQAVLAHPALALLVPPDEVSIQAALFKAPEEVVAIEGDPDGRADLYALGMLGWRLLTGEFPFAAVALSDAYRHHLGTAPASPRTRNSDIPARLSAIVMKLLAKAPDQRYQSAAGLLADLESWEQSTDRPLGTRDVPRPFAATQPIFGRETAREALLASLGRARTGQGSVVALAGAPGMGIERLLRAMQPELLATGALMLRARPPGHAPCPPFFLLRAWIDDLLSQWDLLPDLRRRDLLYRLHQAVRGNGGLLGALVPGLVPLLPDGGPPLALDAARNHIRVLHTMAEAFVALADPRHPLLLWIEDLTCLDSDSLALLRFLNDRLPQSALVIAGSHAINGGVTSSSADWLQHPATRKHLVWVEVPPLGADTLARTVAASLGIPFDVPPPEAGDLVRALATWIERRWGGTPLAQDLALRLLVSRDALLPDATRRLHGMPWRVDADALERVRIPDSTAGLVREWLATLPEGLILTLEAAATLPGAVTLEGLSVAMDGFPAEALEERLEAAVHHGVLYRAWDGLRFAEPTLREAIVHATSAIRSELCHQALGAAVEARTDAPPLQRHHEAACHFRAGADPERAGVHTLALVSAALAAGALHSAIAAYSALPESARQRLPHADCLALIAAYGAVGQHQDAVDLASRRLPVAGSEAEQAELSMAQADQAAALGDTAAALSAAEQALSLLGEPLPSHSVGAALARLADGAARRYGEFLSNAAGGALTRLTEDEERHCRALETYACIAAWQHPERAVAADERILRIAASRAVSGHGLRALIRMGRLEAHPDARPLQEAAQLLQGADLPSEAMAFEIAHGDGAVAQFELLRAREAFDRARVSARALGDLNTEAEAELALFHVACLQGPAEGLTRCAERLQRLAVLTHSLDLEVIAKATGAVARAATGSADPAATISAVVAAAEHFSARGEFDKARRWITAALDLMLVLGHSTEARRCIALADRLGNPLSTWEAGRLTAALGEWHLTVALALPDQPHPLQQARSELKTLRTAGRDHALLAALCEGLAGIERIAQGRAKEGVAQVAALEAAFDAQGARLLWGRMCLRAAEALKPRGDKEWLAWGGKALIAFDGAGASGFSAATRRLLDVQPTEEPVAPAQTAVAGQVLAASGLLSWFERLAGDSPPAVQSLHDAVVRLFLEHADAERAALYTLNADGQLALTCQLPEDVLAREPFNRWMVESVRRDGRGQVAEHYLPQDADPAATAARDAQSVLCLPLMATGSVQGVVALASSRSRRVYDSGDLAQLSPVAQQAGVLLALSGTLTQSRTQSTHAAERQKRDHQWLDWSLRAGSTGSVAELLSDYVSTIARPMGFEAALLYRTERDVERSLPVEEVCVLPPLTAPEAPSTLPAYDSESQMAAARRLLSPMPMSGGGTPPSPAEQALFNRWHARDAVWLPLAIRGDTIGTVLLLSGERRALSPQQLEADLHAPLMAIAPTIAHLWQAAQLREQHQVLLRDQAAIREGTGQLRRYLPAALDGVRPHPERPGEAIEVAVPVIAGHMQGMNRLAALGAPGWSRSLGSYFERIGQALELHQGVLDRIAAPGWLAHFPGGVNNAVWGAHTLHELLTIWEDDQATRGGASFKSSIGLHLGPVVAGTFSVGERLEAVLDGEAVHGAQALAEMAEELRCNVLISGDLAQAATSLVGVALRPFGAMRLGPGERRLEVFDLYSIAAKPVAATMTELAEMWDSAMRHFRLGEWDRAWPLFHRYASRLPEDRPARYFLRRCKLRQREEVEASRREN